MAITIKGRLRLKLRIPIKVNKPRVKHPKINWLTLSDLQDANKRMNISQLVGSDAFKLVKHIWNIDPDGSLKNTFNKVKQQKGAAKALLQYLVQQPVTASDTASGPQLDTGHLSALFAEKLGFARVPVKDAVTPKPLYGRNDIFDKAVSGGQATYVDGVYRFKTDADMTAFISTHSPTVSNRLSMGAYIRGQQPVLMLNDEQLARTFNIRSTYKEQGIHNTSSLQYAKSFLLGVPYNYKIVAHPETLEKFTDTVIGHETTHAVHKDAYVRDQTNPFGYDQLDPHNVFIEARADYGGLSKNSIKQLGIDSNWANNAKVFLKTLSPNDMDIIVNASRVIALNQPTGDLTVDVAKLLLTSYRSKLAGTVPKQDKQFSSQPVLEVGEVGEFNIAQWEAHDKERRKTYGLPKYVSPPIVSKYCLLYTSPSPRD